VEELAGVIEIGCFGRAILIHEECVIGSAEVGEVGCEVGPGFGMSSKGLVPVVRNMADEGAYAAIIKVHGVDVCDRDATNAVDDDIIFVTGWRSDGKVTGAGDAK